jgi:hypothetical protein
MDGVMPASNGNKRPERGLTLRRALAGLLCLALLLAGLHAGHSDDRMVALAFEVAALEGGHDHSGSAGHGHAIGAGCSLAHACTMSATLAGLAGPPVPASPLFGLGDDRLHCGLDTSPRPHPPKLSAAV